MNILLVDSSVQHLNWLVKALKTKIFLKKIMIAMTASEAYEAIASHSYELIITDINLPDESGMNLLNHIKSEYPASEVIIYTNADNDTLSFLRDRTGVKCFEKPSEFTKVVNYVLGKTIKK